MPKRNRREQRGPRIARKRLLAGASGAAAILAASRFAFGLPASLTPKTAADEIQKLRAQLQELTSKVQAMRVQNTAELAKAVQALKQADYLCAQAFETIFKF